MTGSDVPRATVGPETVSRRSAIAARSPRPSSTTMSFVLLVALIALTGVFLGAWLRIVTYGQVESRTPLAWVVVPPALILGATVVATWLESSRIVRSRGLTPVPPEYPGAIRFAELAAEAGVTTPRLMQNEQDGTVSARSVGRPGNYIVIVSPVVLAAARRRRLTFDIILRHELEHVRSGDVVLATFAVLAWYVTLVAMAIPLLAVPWTRDFSLVPSYLVRVGVLALVVYLVRAQLLRLREHYADVAATVAAEERSEFITAAASAPRVPVTDQAHRRPRLRRAVEHIVPAFALHPTGTQRAAVVEAPLLLARPLPATLLVAGFATGAAQGLLEPILIGTGMTVQAAVDLTRWLLFGLVGIVGAAEVMRASSGGRPGARHFFLPSACLVLGAALGASASLGVTGQEGSILSELVEVAIPTLAVAFLLLAGAGAAHAGTSRRGAVPVFLALGAITSASTAALWGNIAFPIAQGIPIDAFILLSAYPSAVYTYATTVGVASLLLMPWARWRTIIAAVLVVGLLGLAAPVAAGLQLGSLDPPLSNEVLASAGPLTGGIALIGTLALTLWHGPAAGVVTGMLGSGLAAGGFVVFTAVLGSGMTAADSLDAATWSGALMLVLGLPLAALMGLVPRRTPPARPSRKIRWAVVITAFIVSASALGGAGIAWVAPATEERVAREDTMPTDPQQLYLERVLPLVVTEWNLARGSADLAQYVSDVGPYVRQNVLPLFDNALKNARSYDQWIADIDVRTLTQLHDALVEALSAERSYWDALASGDAEATKEAMEEAVGAIQHFEEVYQVATDGG